MNRYLRGLLLLPGILGIAFLLLWAFTRIPRFGSDTAALGDVFNQVAVGETNATNAVSAVNFDYRGTDTLGEEYILFTAVASVALLLRAQREEREESPEDVARGREVPGTSSTVVVVSVMLAGLSLLLGVYIVAHGSLTPGGGFQGGVVLSTALLVLYVAGRYSMFARMTSIPNIERTEAFGAGLFAVFGIAGLLAAGSFLANFVPHGTTGKLVSSGTILLLNASVGLEVGAGFILIIDEFLEQALLIRHR